MKNTLFYRQLAFVSILTVSLSLISCSDNDEDSIFWPIIEMPQEGASYITVTDENVVDGGQRYKFTVKLNEPASSHLLCDIVVDESLVESYNSKHQTSYRLMPASVYTIEGKNAIIISGKQESDSLSIYFHSLYGLKKGEAYLLPIVAVPDETCAGKFNTNDNSISYFALNINMELNYISGLRMSSANSSMSASLSFVNNETVTITDNTHTYEMLIYPYSWGSSMQYIGTWRGKDLNNNNEVFSGCEIRVTNGVHHIGNRQCDLSLTSQGLTIPKNKWSLITISCDGTKTGQSTEVAYRLYVDGELIREANPTKRYGPSSSQRFMVGYSLTGIQFGYSGGYYFDGLISEVRMWKKCLTQEEIKANLRSVDSSLNEHLYGYWKLNDEEGNTLKDSSGNERDLTYPAATVVKRGAELDRQ